jgi:hypothetical protein
MLLSDCAKRDIVSIDRQDHFAIDIGRLEGEIDLVNLEGPREKYKTAIAMREGLFYISNGNGQKVMRYNSYGDLLFMIYNDATNPKPLTLRPQTETDQLTRWSIAFPLDSPGEIAVDSRKHIYVEDILPDDRHSYDPERHILLDRTVLHFDTNGRFVNYLGQEGPGGAPFPMIESITISTDDEISVICVIPEGRQIFWYDSNGSLLYTISFMSHDIPLPDEEKETRTTMERIVASQDSHTIYIKADYYYQSFDESTKMLTGIEVGQSIVWEMNIENGQFTNRLEIPFYDYSGQIHGRKFTDKMIYSMLGAAAGKNLFFYVPLEDGYAILILDMNSPETQTKGKVLVSQEETQLNAFTISPDGILSALLSDQWQARVVWWRTDIKPKVAN